MAIRAPQRRSSRALSVVLTALATAAALGATHAYLLDGLDGLVWAALLPDDTEYAAGYTDAGFRRVGVAMTFDDVRRLIGEPERSWPLDGSSSQPDLGARWSYSPGNTNFRCRVLLFREQRVVRKHAEFYVD